MSVRLRSIALLTCALATLSASALAPGLAGANNTEQSVFQDDALLIYASNATVNRTLSILKSLGVERVRVNVKWSTVAPRPSSRRRPKFNAANPSAYPRGVWVPYDRVALFAKRHGMQVEFNLTAPGPLWAMRHDSPNTRAADHWAPNVSEFFQFVEAAGIRYSGTYGAIPRVNIWSIWNEPNQPGWLAPQWRQYNGSWVLNSPRLYREYVEAAFGALYFTGHLFGADAVLVGELAPEGYSAPGSLIATTPMPFLRALYCVDSGYHPLTGNAAAALGCPTSGPPSQFVQNNIGLFYATGFAHHPYYFNFPPSYNSPDPNFVPIANLSRLEGGLDRIFKNYGVNRQIPIFLTEYGYETNPPDPFRVVTPAQQAAYLNEADYLAWRDPRVYSVAQFLLYDAKPDKRYKPSDFKYWDTFQTGLLYANGAAKPAYDAYRLPIWIPFARAHQGSSMLVWGQLRLAPHTTPQAAQIQWRAAGGKYKTLVTVTATGPEDYLTASIKPPASGYVRIAWTGRRGVVYVSREVPVSVS